MKAVNMKNKRFLIIILVAVFLIAWICSGTVRNMNKFTGPTSHDDPLPPELITELERYVQETMKRNEVNGLSMVLVHADQVVYNQAFGIRNVQTQAPVNPDTLFGIGSATKQ